MKNKTLTKILEDTQELTESSCFSNGGNLNYKELKKIEVRSCIFSNEDKFEVFEHIKNRENITGKDGKIKGINKNIKEIDKFQINHKPATFLKEEISNISIEQSHDIYNDEFTKMSTYEKCVEILNKIPFKIEEHIIQHENFREYSEKCQKYDFCNSNNSSNSNLKEFKSNKNN